MTDQHLEAEQAAFAVVDKFIEDINRHDLEGLVQASNLPHVRFASGKVAVYETEEQFRNRYRALFTAPLEPGWHHSTVDEKKAIHSGADKVHVAVQFTRWTADHQLIATYQSLYIVTRVNGHWGVQARSSYAQ